MAAASVEAETEGVTVGVATAEVRVAEARAAAKVAVATAARAMRAGIQATGNACSHNKQTTLVQTSLVTRV